MVLYFLKLIIVLSLLLSGCASRRSTYYKIRGRDTIDKIAKINDITIEKIIAANGNFNPDELKAGEILFIPKEEVKKKRGLWDILMDYRQYRQAESPSKTKTLIGNLMWPLDSARFSSYFGKRKLNGNYRMHHGVDLVAKIGSPIKAAESGYVIYSGNGVSGYGNMVIVKHSKELSTVYAHNKRNLVKKGDLVKKGQRIALLGNTGKSTGAHLHFEVRVNKKAVNPIRHLVKK